MEHMKAAQFQLVYTNAHAQSQPLRVITLKFYYCCWLFASKELSHQLPHLINKDEWRQERDVIEFQKQLDFNPWFAADLPFMILLLFS